jgi:uncharacterized membrane protein YkvI
MLMLFIHLSNRLFPLHLDVTLLFFLLVVAVIAAAAAAAAYESVNYEQILTELA